MKDEESARRVFHGERLLEDLHHISTCLTVASQVASRIGEKPVTLREFLMECIKTRALSSCELVAIGICFQFDSDTIRMELGEMANEHVVEKYADKFHVPKVSA
jgi:hypothetical protein